jgi:hypothetical protein
MKASFQYGLYGLSLLALLAAGVLGSCQGTIVGEDDPGIFYSDDFDPDSVVAVLELVQGHVKLQGSFWLLTYPRPEEGEVKLNVPDLPDSLRQDGLAVVFSGEVHPIPPYVRMLGDPFTITYIARREP